METNERWVTQRMAALDPDWHADVASGFARLRNAGDSKRRRPRTWTWAAAATAAAGVVLMALPPTRTFAQYCLECSSVLWQGLTAQHIVVKQRVMAPDFELKDEAGRPVRLSSLRGKVVLLNFWATWCGGCKVEIPWLVEFERDYANRGLAIVGVSMDEDGWKVVSPFVKSKQINYRVLLGNDAVAKLYGIEAMPASLVIDRSGRIAAKHVGLPEKADYASELERVLIESR